MGLRDHFHPPLHPLHHWDSFHSNWATRIADALNERWLPKDYIAEEHTHVGANFEIDIATWNREATAGLSDDTAEVTKRWSPPAPDTAAPLALPDSFEVRVLTDTGGATLVGVIELVSPGNKDRPEQRRAFATKCAGFLHQGVGVVIADVVTSRHGNLHNEIVDLLGAPALRLPPEVSLYAAAYRPVARGEQVEVEAWLRPCALGEGLPTLPLRLQGELFVPVDLESSYQEACLRRRIPLE